MLFALLAERYERRSVMITSNLVFSQWNQIFHDDMTAAAVSTARKTRRGEESRMNAAGRGRPF